MVKWVPDRTGRFPQRPHYEMDELDRECEGMIVSFLRKKRRRVTYPISTEDLKILLEQETGDLDLYADLTEEGEGVEGVTDFFRGRKPTVRIARELSEDDRRENRLRTTLTHEFGHVKFHDFLWFFEQSPLSAAGNTGSPFFSPTCKRDSMLNASTTDWLEWQAGHASGALLMPITALQRSINDFFDKHDLAGPLALDTPPSKELILHIQATFQVSADAARVRLLKRGCLIEMN